MSAPALPPLSELDPRQAWKPWEPDANRPWNLQRAAHLFRRAAFGAPPYTADAGTWDGLQRAVKEGPERTLALLLDGGPGQAEFDRLMDELAPGIGKGRRFDFEPDAGLQEMQAWWLYRMIYTPHPLRERLTLFWHNHFATSNAKVKRGGLMLKQNQLIRAHALGKFQPFLLAMSKDPAMLIWLDSNSNVKSQANENYARELMELFSLGVGNYTEQDVREAARAFTGWHTGGQDFLFNPAQHDDGPKTVLGQTGNWDGADVLRIILEQPATAVFLVRKLYRQFIAENAAPPDELLEPLAVSLRQSDYDVAGVVQTMLRSRLFVSGHAYRQRIKGPADFIVGLVRSLDGRPAPGALARALEGMGQKLFAPSTVKGWDGGKAWLNSATLLARHNLAWSLVGGTPGNPSSPRVPSRAEATAKPTADGPVGLVQKYAGKEAAGQVSWLLDLLLQGDVEPADRQKLVDFLQQGEPRDKEWEKRVREVAHTILLMPEYQLA